MLSEQPTLEELETNLTHTNKLLGSGIKGGEYRLCLEYADVLKFAIRSCKAVRNLMLGVQQLQTENEKLKVEQPKFFKAEHDRDYYHGELAKANERINNLLKECKTKDELVVQSQTALEELKTEHNRNWRFNSQV